MESETEGHNIEAAWDALIENIATGKVSILGTIKKGRAALWADGDHLGFVTATRALHVMFEDKRIQRRFLEESRAEFERVTKPKSGYEEKQHRGIRAKDGFRLFDKLQNVQADAYADSPRLIQTGASFQEALATHHKGAVINARLDRILGAKEIK
jgi:hypothetical protein